MKLFVRHLPGLTGYEDAWQQMKEFTDARTPDTRDELWWVQHNPVFTLGQAGKPEHLLAPGDIPIVKSDRGGQVTYHGPGQLVGYLMMDIRRMGMGVRDLVSGIEHAVIALLKELDVAAESRRDAPGVYVNQRKIASLGLRIRKGCSYHGLSLNVDMDLGPFGLINPCGYQGLEVTDLRQLGVTMTVEEAAELLSDQLVRQFGYDGVLYRQGD